MSVPTLTVDELVSTLKKTSLPTVLVEGQDDMRFYRWIEKHLPGRASLLSCDGRTTLLAVYDRRKEFHRLKATFLADKDMWLFTAIPKAYSDVIWTSGYSIENDIIADSKIDELLSEEENIQYKNLVTEIIKWFAFEVEVFRSGGASKQSVKLSKLIVGSRLSDAYLQNRRYRPPNTATIEEITENWKLRLRGKTLLDVLTKILGQASRSPNYGGGQLLEIGVKLSPNKYVTRLIKEISNALG